MTCLDMDDDCCTMTPQQVSWCCEYQPERGTCLRRLPKHCSAHEGCPEKF